MSRVGAGNGVFISYRRASSTYVAVLLRDRLTARGVDVFLDLASLDSGRFETALLREVARRPHFVVLLDPAARLGGPAPTTGWMRREIACALAATANIVPVMLDGARFEDLDLPADVAALADHNAVVFSHDHLDASVEKVARFVGSRGTPWRGRLRRLAAALVATRRRRLGLLVAAVAVVLAVGITTTLVALAPTVIGVAGRPEHLALSPTGERLYVSGSALVSGRDSLSVVDTATETEIGSVPLRGPPGDIALSFDGGTAYVPVGVSPDTAASPGSLAVVDLVRVGVRTEIPLPGPVGGGVALTRDGARLFVSLRSGSVLAIDTATNRVVGTGPALPDVAAQQRIALTADGRRLFLSGRGGFRWAAPTIWAIDTTTLAVVATLPLGGSGSFPDDLVVTDDGRWVYVPDGDGRQVWVVDPASATLARTIALRRDLTGTHAITTDRHGAAVVLSTLDSGAVVSFLGFDDVIGTVPADLGGFPSDVEFAVDENRVFVADHDGVHVVSLDAFS